MGSPPLAALSIQTQQPNPLDTFARIFQIKGMQQQQANAATQGQLEQLKLKQAQLEQQDDEKWRTVLSDPSWDGTTQGLLQKGRQQGVGIESYGAVQKVLSQGAQAYAALGKEQLGLQDALGNKIGDLLQTVQAAPPEQKLQAQQEAKHAVIQLVTNTPGLPPQSVKQVLASIQQIPDDVYVGDSELARQIGMNKMHTALVDEGLKAAQTNEATAKGGQATQEGNLAAAKIPGAQAESTIEGQNAALTPTDRALAGNLFYQSAGGNKQATGALAQETAQKVATAQAGVANVPDALKGVAPHLVAPAAAAAEKAGNEYGDAVAAARDMKTFVDLARAGNKIAYSYSPTEGVLTLNTARGVKRVNMPEIESYGGAGSAADRVAAWLGKNISGASIPTDVLNDMETLHQSVAANAKQTYAGKLKNTNSTYGSKFQPVDIGGGTVRMRAPNGQEKDVDPADVDHFKKQGATVVNP